MVAMAWIPLYCPRCSLPPAGPPCASFSSLSSVFLMVRTASRSRRQLLQPRGRCYTGSQVFAQEGGQGLPDFR